MGGGELFGVIEVRGMGRARPRLRIEKLQTVESLWTRSAEREGPFDYM